MFILCCWILISLSRIWINLIHVLYGEPYGQPSLSKQTIYFLNSGTVVKMNFDAVCFCKRNPNFFKK